MLKTFRACMTGLTALVATVTGASAGGLSDQIVEQPVVPDVVEAPAASRVPG